MSDGKKEDPRLFHDIEQVVREPSHHHATEATRGWGPSQRHALYIVRRFLYRIEEGGAQVRPDRVVVHHGRVELLARRWMELDG